MSKSAPTTRVTRFLRDRGIAFTEHLYRYEDRGGTRVSARELGVAEHQVVKTLVMEDDRGDPLLVLMHGDREVSTKSLARLLGKRSIRPCRTDGGERHSGYRVGGTSPFATRASMPVYVERTILDLPRVFVNGGARGFLVGIEPRVLLDALGAERVDVGISSGSIARGRA